MLLGVTEALSCLSLRADKCLYVPALMALPHVLNYGAFGLCINVLQCLKPVIGSSLPKELLH